MTIDDKDIDLYIISSHLVLNFYPKSTVRPEYLRVIKIHINIFKCSFFQQLSNNILIKRHTFSYC